MLWGVIGGGVLILVVAVAGIVSRMNRRADAVPPVAEVTPVAADATPIAPAKPRAAAFSERAVAEWVISVGGRVNVLEPGRASFDVYDSTSLPKGDFRIEAISLDGLDAVNDQQLGQLWGLQAMHELGLSRTKVTDAGLEHLPQLASLTSLNLRGCPISDTGLASLGRLQNLTFLVADGGLSPVRPFSDDGIRLLAGLKQLQTLALVSESVSNPGLASIADSSPKLSQLRTVGFKVTDEGVIPLTKLSNLRVLELSKSLLTDKSIETLSQLTWLTHLIVQGT